jgi:H-type lectin domain
MTESGTVSSVAADGSSTTPVTFTTPFSSAPPVVVSVIAGTSSTGSAVVAQVFAVTATGFSIYCTGGQPLSTVSISWLAIL